MAKQERILTGETAAITGGARGIGRATAAAFLRRGMKVAIGDVDLEAAQQTASELGPSAVALPLDVCDRGSFSAFLDGAEEQLGPVDVLVNNAGITRDAMLHRMSKDNWDAVMRTNLDSVFNMTRLVIEGMRQRNFGRIINIASIIGRKGGVGQANYSAAKAGLLGFSKAVAQEAAARGITVNVIAPGFIATEMVQAVPREVLETKILPQIPVGRLGTAEEIARCVAFLAADEAGFITGACLDANGGQYMA